MLDNRIPLTKWSAWGRKGTAYSSFSTRVFYGDSCSILLSYPFLHPDHPISVAHTNISAAPHLPLCTWQPASQIEFPMSVYHLIQSPAQLHFICYQSVLRTAYSQSLPKCQLNLSLTVYILFCPPCLALWIHLISEKPFLITPFPCSWVCFWLPNTWPTVTLWCWHLYVYFCMHWLGMW